MRAIFFRIEITSQTLLVEETPRRLYPNLHIEPSLHLCFFQTTWVDRLFLKNLGKLCVQYQARKIEIEKIDLSSNNFKSTLGALAAEVMILKLFSFYMKILAVLTYLLFHSRPSTAAIAFLELCPWGTYLLICSNNAF